MLRLRSRIALLLASVPLLCGGPAGGTAPGGLPQALAAEVAAIGSTAREVGVHVVDLSERREVFAHDADRSLILASNTKLFTTAASLLEFGPDFRFRTRLEMRGEIVGGTLHGDLAVFGAGDPNLSGRFHDGDSFAPFRPWARALRERGVNRVEGRLLLVNGLFEGPNVHPAWPRNQLSAWYEAPVEALSFNDNCVLVRVEPGRRVGLPARPSLEPPVEMFSIRNTARTIAGSRGRLLVDRAPDGNGIVVAGTIGERSRGLEIWVAVRDPAAYFAAGLRAAFAQEGVGLPTGHAVEHPPLAGEWTLVAVHESELSRTLAVTNKRSQNFYAESLAKLLGWTRHGRGSWESGTTAVSELLGDLGLDRAGFTLTDGSGLARGNRASARVVTGLLDRMYFHPYGRDFLRSLPYSGEPELSWRKRLAEPPFRGNVFAKTGTLNGVSTLSGYARSVSGRVYAFSILLNRTRGAWVSREIQDRLVRTLVERG